MSDDTPQADIDDIALAIPEFRMPDEEEEDLDLPTQNLPGDVLEMAASVDRSDNTETTERPGFDREELVRTVKMEAFDRAQVEALANAVSFEENDVLIDHRFAPDVLVRPPRVLTKKWQDGAHPRGTEPNVDRQFTQTVRTEKSEPIESEVETEIELDESVLEEAEPIAPPKPPPVRTTEELPTAPPKVIVESQSSGSQITGQFNDDDGDDDLNGIVQELLEDKKKPEERAPLSPEEKQRQGWCAELFDEEYLRTLPKHLKRETEREVRFIKQSLNLSSGARILDLACGFGRHAVELAQTSDYEVAGLDLSMVMLQHALGEAQRRDLSIKFIHGDMRELKFPEIFDACYCWQTSFGYFDDRTNISVLNGIHKALKNGGRFLVDVINRDHIVSEMPTRTWWEGIECVFLEEVEFDYNLSVLHTKRSYIYEDGSPPREYSSFIRLYSLHELTKLLNFCGFKVIEVSGEIHHRTNFLGAASSRVIILAEKMPVPARNG